MIPKYKLGDIVEFDPTIKGEGDLRGYIYRVVTRQERLPSGKEEYSVEYYVRYSNTAYGMPLDEGRIKKLIKE